MADFKNPKPTVDIVILMNVPYIHTVPKLILVKRKNPPYGWALPGGFVDEGESYESAAIREAKEETGLHVDLVEQFYTYSNPKRDPRQHTCSTVFLAHPCAKAQPVAGDDASEVVVVTSWDASRLDLAFDHKAILQDVYNYLLYGVRPTPFNRDWL